MWFRPFVLILVVISLLGFVPADASLAGRSGPVVNGAIRITVPGTAGKALWRFSGTEPNGVSLGTIPVPKSAQAFEKATIKASPDGRWVAQGWISAEPPLLLEIGHPGGPLSPVNIPGQPLDSILAFDFSPDSRYLTYTFYTTAWTFGIIDLQSGQKAEFSATAASNPLEIDPAAPFGHMIPTAAAWSSDSQWLYFETFIMVGCRGPHAIYTAQVADVFRSAPGLPHTRLITPAGADVFSYAFSPSGDVLAAALDRADCGYPTQLAAISLPSGQFRELLGASAGRSILTLGWEDNGGALFFISDAAPEGDSGPVFPLHNPRVLRINRSGGGPAKLPDLSTNDQDAIESLVLGSGKAYYVVSSGDDSDPARARTLYARPLNGAADKAIVLSQAEGPMTLTRCADMIFIVASSGSNSTLNMLPVTASGANEFHALLSAPQIEIAGCAQP